MNHQARYNARLVFCSDELTPERLLTECLQSEVKSLEELLVPLLFAREGWTNNRNERSYTKSYVNGKWNDHPERLQRSIRSGRQLHVISNQSTVFHPVFTTLDNTSAVTNEPHVWNRWVPATNDFCRTIVPSEGGAPSKWDEFLRPVQWIVSSQTPIRQVLVILSPMKWIDYCHTSARASTFIYICTPHK